MTTQRPTSPKLPGWLIGFASTLFRCHMIGSITVAALVLCMAWIWTYNTIEVATIQYDGTVIDLADATALIENADRWRQLYTVNYRKSQGVDQRVESIAAWLPRSVDWPTTQHDIRSIGEAAELSILVIKLGDQHVGTRVGVLSASCDVQGSHVSLCRFLSDLSNRPQPIACSEIKLHRKLKGDSSEADGVTPQCKATLSLRIPFAARGTAAGRLLLPPTETENAS